MVSSAVSLVHFLLIGLPGVIHTKAIAAGQLGVAGQLRVQRVISCRSARSCWSTPSAEGD